MKKIIVFSAILGDYEPIKNDQAVNGADFVLFTDKHQPSNIWWQRPAKDLFKDPRRNARWHKINSLEQFGEYEYTIWIDGSMTTKIAPIYLVADYMQGFDIAVFRHPLRNSLYDEAQTVITKGFDDIGIINKQLERYHAEGYPAGQGLGETKCVIRRNSPKVKQFEMIWNNEVTNYSKRDQISFNYAVWKAGLSINYIPVELKDHEAVYPGFKYTKHVRT